MPYFVAPFIGWFFSGILKFIINYVRFGSEAKSRIGNGGFPSTHTTVMVTPTTLIGINNGIFSPVFGLAVAITFIIVIDATGLRTHVGRHAKILNQLKSSFNDTEVKAISLRESMGHSKMEVAGGISLGVLLGYCLDLLMDYL